MQTKHAASPEKRVCRTKKNTISRRTLLAASNAAHHTLLAAFEEIAAHSAAYDRPRTALKKVNNKKNRVEIVEQNN